MLTPQTVTVNDAIMKVGDVTSVKNCDGLQWVVVINTITVDSTTGLQVDDIVAATGIPGNTKLIRLILVIRLSL